jgi:hypothetical protein
MSAFNELELSIFEWLKTNYNDGLLTSQINSAQFIKREWTKVGFFVELEVSKQLEPINLRNFEGHWPIYGPEIESDDIENGAGTLIWGKNGYLDCIEIFAWGNFCNEKVRKFKLSERKH